MTDINVDAELVSAAKSTMKNNMDSIVSELKTLQTAIQTLLTNDGGLWMRQSSPLMSEQFTKFANDLSNTVGNIESFSLTFQSITDNLTSLDQGYSSVGG